MVSQREHNFAVVLVNDGGIEWVNISRYRLRVKTMKLVERWLRGEIEGIYLGRRSS